jgi:hypothetical protein
VQTLTKFAPREFSGDFFRPSPYRGAGDDVDEAWDNLWMSKLNGTKQVDRCKALTNICASRHEVGGVPVRIDESRLKTLQKNPSRNWTRVPDALGGGIAGYPEVFHQLHCLVSQVQCLST